MRNLFNSRKKIIIIVLSLSTLFIVILFFLIKPHSENYPEKERPFLKDLFTKQKKPQNTCLTNEDYKLVDNPNAPVLSLPFDINDYSTKYWGIVPFCAELRNKTIHSGLDFELKPNSKVFSSTDGIVDHTQVGKEEGSGEIIAIAGSGFTIDYSGLTNLQVKKGDRVKSGDYIGNAVQIPHGEYHLHIGVSINGKQECPLKYMDEEFMEAFKQMFAKADYGSQTNARCACDCENVIPDY